MHPYQLSLSVAALLFGTKVLAGVKPWVSPEYKHIFQFPLPIPPPLEPIASYTNKTTGKSIDFYQIEILDFEKQIYPELQTTSLTGYNGMAPGPTLHMTRGREAVVRFINSMYISAPMILSVLNSGFQDGSEAQVLGTEYWIQNPGVLGSLGCPSNADCRSYSRTPFDGWAEDVTSPNQYKDYYYPNAQPQRTLWYHDHAIGETAVNAYFGQAGFYILKDPAATGLQLPSGDYDIPLMIATKQFLSTGKLLSPENERDSLFGDVNTVNGQPWPYLNVENRKYKFRLLDASVSRSYSLYLVADSDPKTRIPFIVVGADAGYLDHPASTTSLVIAMAERYEIVIDFAKYKGQNMTLMNERDFQACLPATILHEHGNGDIPTHLADLNIPAARTTVDQIFEFGKSNGGQWLINGIGFEDVKNRVVAFPPQGKVQRWRLVNKGGGWSHPIHIHLIDFQVVSRTGSGRSGVTPYEAAALKDVVYLGTNEQVEVIANFAPWSGVYMFHCHNLVHEDHDMMAAFNVSQVDLSSLGYPEKVSFNDPMAPLFRAKAYVGTDLGQVENVLLPYFQNLDAYPNAAAVEKALDEYYAHPPKTPSPTSPSATATARAATSTTKRK
ncbi:bilirubin oxidase [Diplocarpon mali]|nr:bilirubin oxidase [Diplocarpon mali]